MDARAKAILDAVMKIVAEPLGEQLLELRALRRELDHAKREIEYLKLEERSRRSRRNHRRALYERT